MCSRAVAQRRIETAGSGGGGAALGAAEWRLFFFMVQYGQLVVRRVRVGATLTQIGPPGSGKTTYWYVRGSSR